MCDENRIPVALYECPQSYSFNMETHVCDSSFNERCSNTEKLQTDTTLVETLSSLETSTSGSISTIQTTYNQITDLSN